MAEATGNTTAPSTTREGRVVTHKTDHYEVTVAGDQIYGNCRSCGSSETWPNKGLGRAHAAAWRTRHQHNDDHQEADPKTPPPPASL